MARSRFIVNQLDLTNTQSPQSVMLIDTSHTGIAIGSATPTINKINIGAWGDYPNGIDFNAGNGAGFNFYMMNSSGATFHVGSSNGLQVVDDGQGSAGVQVDLTGGSPIEMSTNGAIIKLETTASGAPVVLDSDGDNLLYSRNGRVIASSYKDGIILYNDATAVVGSEIRIDNNAVNGNIVVEGNGIIDIVSASSNDSALRLRSTDPAGCVDIISDLDIRLTATDDIILSAGGDIEFGASGFRWYTNTGDPIDSDFVISESPQNHLKFRNYAPTAMLDLQYIEVDMVNGINIWNNVSAQGNSGIQIINAFTTHYIRLDSQTDYRTTISAPNAGLNIWTTNGAGCYWDAQNSGGINILLGSSSGFDLTDSGVGSGGLETDFTESVVNFKAKDLSIKTGQNSPSATPYGIYIKNYQGFTNESSINRGISIINADISGTYSDIIIDNQVDYAGVQIFAKHNCYINVENTTGVGGNLYLRNSTGSGNGAWTNIESRQTDGQKYAYLQFASDKQIYLYSWDATGSTSNYSHLTLRSDSGDNYLYKTYNDKSAQIRWTSDPKFNFYLNGGPPTWYSCEFEMDLQGIDFYLNTDTGTDFNIYTKNTNNTTQYLWLRSDGRFELQTYPTWNLTLNPNIRYQQNGANGQWYMYAGKYGYFNIQSNGYIELSNQNNSGLVMYEPPSEGGSGDVRLHAYHNLYLEANNGGQVIISPTVKINGMSYNFTTSKVADSPITLYPDGYWLYNCDTVGGAMVVNLPLIDGVSIKNGQSYMVKNIGVNTVTVNGNSGQTIDGATSQVLSQWESMQVVAVDDGGTYYWIVI